MKRWGACVLVLALAGCGGGGKKSAPPAPSRPAPRPAQGSVPWPAPPDPMELTRKAGLTPETHEFVFLHIHAHLDVFVNGRPTTVPTGIGIDIDDPAVKRFKASDGSVGYGGISPLHTHFTDGVLHTEAKQNQFNNLGEFFTEWNVRLDPRCVGGYCKPAAPISVYVDGDLYTGDARQIELKDQREIAIVIGTAPTKIPAAFPR